MDKEKPNIDNGIQQACEQHERQQKRRKRRKLNVVEVALFDSLGMTKRVVPRKVPPELEQQPESD